MNHNVNSTTISSSIRPICVVDLEVTGCGMNKEKNRIIAIGAVVITPEYMRQKINSRINHHSHNTTNRHQSFVFLPEDIPVHHKFQIYIHDTEALQEIEKGSENVKEIWSEPEGNQFWLKNTVSSRSMLNKALSMMQSSIADPKSAMFQLETWLQSIIKVFPNVVLASDVCNFDFSWIDHYRSKYLNLPSINFIKNGKYESPMDIGSYLVGIAILPLQSMKKLDLFHTICKQRNLVIPKFKVSHDHTPLNDSILLALQTMYIMTVITSSYLVNPPQIYYPVHQHHQPFIQLHHPHPHYNNSTPPLEWEKTALMLNNNNSSTPSLLNNSNYNNNNNSYNYSMSSSTRSFTTPLVEGSSNIISEKQESSSSPAFLHLSDTSHKADLDSVEKL